jgi:hypothetical protein
MAGLGPKREAGGKSEDGPHGEARPRKKIRPGRETGPKPKGRRIPFLFLFQFFKAIFQKILNPLLNLIQTTQYKNSNAAA